MDDVLAVRSGDGEPGHRPRRGAVNRLVGPAPRLSIRWRRNFVPTCSPGNVGKQCTVVTWIAARGPLREGLSHEEAAAVVWTLTSSEVHLMLRGAWGWPRERSTEWLCDTLLASLFDPRS